MYCLTPTIINFCMFLFTNMEKSSISKKSKDINSQRQLLDMQNRKEKIMDTKKNSLNMGNIYKGSIRTRLAGWYELFVIYCIRILKFSCMRKIHQRKHIQTFFFFPFFGLSRQSNPPYQHLNLQKPKITPRFLPYQPQKPKKLAHSYHSKNPVYRFGTKQQLNQSSRTRLVFPDCTRVSHSKH